MKHLKSILKICGLHKHDLSVVIKAERGPDLHHRQQNILESLKYAIFFPTPVHTSVYIPILAPVHILFHFCLIPYPCSCSNPVPNLFISLLLFLFTSCSNSVYFLTVVPVHILFHFCSFPYPCSYSHPVPLLLISILLFLFTSCSYSCLFPYPSSCSHPVPLLFIFIVLFLFISCSYSC